MAGVRRATASLKTYSSGLFSTGYQLVHAFEALTPSPSPVRRERVAPLGRARTIPAVQDREQRF